MSKKERSFKYILFTKYSILQMKMKYEIKIEKLQN